MMRPRMRALASLLGLIVGCSSSPSGPAPDAPIVVFAAASLSDVLPQIAADWPGGTVTFDFGASSRLAPQIIEGAPADLFLPAAARWMDHPVAHRKIHPPTRVHPL